MSRFNTRRCQERGLTLIEILIGAALVGLLALILGSLFNSVLQVTNSVRVSDAQQNLVFGLTKNLDCYATFTTRPAGCDAPPYEIDVYDKNNNIIIPIPTGGTPKLFQNTLQIRALCKPCNGVCADDEKLVVEFRKKGEIQWMDLGQGIPFSCLIPDA